MIKFIRVIANLAINENAGEQLANRQDLLDTILKILGNLNQESFCILFYSKNCFIFIDRNQRSNMWRASYGFDRNYKQYIIL